jgi:cytochrome c-type biogenesis protein CcmH/NrfG
MRGAWILAGLVALGGCSALGGSSGLIPETPLLGRPLALRGGGGGATEAIAELEIKQDWQALSALSEKLAGSRPGGDDDWLVVFGYARMRSGDYPKAIEAFQRVADRVPEDPDPRNMLGETLRLSGQIDRAIQVLERAVQAHPNSHQGWYLLGESYMSHNRLERARAAYAESIRIEPEYVTGLFGLAAVLARVGPKDDYEQVLAKLKAIRPELLEAHKKDQATRRR